MRDLAQVLAELGIEAKLRGKHLRAKCPKPEHDDSSPSWGIRLDERSHPHYCWGCHYAGNLVTLVKDIKKLATTREAEAWLRGRFVEEAPNSIKVRVLEPWLRGMQMPFGVDFTPLDEWVTPARAYAISRGLTAQQVARWGIGYSALGRLSGRVVIPVRDHLGELATYVARSFTGDAQRFINGSKGEGARDGVLLGEHLWDSACETLVVSEGPFDMFALERALAGTMTANVGAFLGSSTPPPIAVWKLARYRRVIAFFDADAAGDAAEVVLRSQLGARMQRARLPAGTDAASSPIERVREEIRQCVARFQS